MSIDTSICTCLTNRKDCPRHGESGLSTISQTNKLGLTEQIECETWSAVHLAMKTNKLLFCDTLKGKHIPIRDARQFSHKNKPGDLESKAPEWTERAFLGQQKGFEVLTLEGWSVPERVYYVERKTDS